jgi:predicted phosphodiesterase
MIADTRARRVAYDAVVLAGDITNLVVTKDIKMEQRRCDQIMSLLCDEYANVYLVSGNRDKTGRGKNARAVDFRRGMLLEPGQVYPLGAGIRITSSPELADNDSVLVQHSNIVYAGRFDRTAVISNHALLHIAGHTHTGVWTRNYLNTGFLYRDDSNGAEPMLGGYFDVEIKGRAVTVEFHALGPVRQARLKSPGFESGPAGAAGDAGGTLAGAAVATLAGAADVTDAASAGAGSAGATVAGAAAAALSADGVASAAGAGASEREQAPRRATSNAGASRRRIMHELLDGSRGLGGRGRGGGAASHLVVCL